MAKFIVGVIVGLFLSTSTTLYGAGPARPGSLSGWPVAKDAAKVCTDLSFTNSRMAIGRG